MFRTRPGRRLQGLPLCRRRSLLVLATSVPDPAGLAMVVVPPAAVLYLRRFLAPGRLSRALEQAIYVLEAAQQQLDIRNSSSA